MKCKSLINVALIIVLLCLLIYISGFRGGEDSEVSHVHNLDEVRRKQVICYLAQAVFDYKKFNEGKYPKNISTLVPSYLTNSNTLLEQKMMEQINITSVQIKKYPEIFDAIGLADIYHTDLDDEFIIVLSPTIYGYDTIPVGYFNEDDFTDGFIDYKKVEYKVFRITEVCELIRKMDAHR